MRTRKLERLFVRLLMSKKYDVSVKKRRKTKTGEARSKPKDQEQSKEDDIEEIEMRRTFSSLSMASSRPRTVKRATREVFDDFCTETSIHGIKYLNQSSWRSRIVWILIYAFALWFCGFLVIDRYQRWEKNPVIISFDKKFESIAEVPFPAVTLCPEIKTDKKKFNYTRVFDVISQFKEDNRSLEFFRLSEEEKEAFQILAQMCLSKGANVSKLLLSKRVDLQSEKVFSILERIAPPFGDLCREYDWAFFKLPKKCSSSKDFSRIITEDGLCYTFNMLDETEFFHNSTVHGYKSNGRLSSNWTKTGGYTGNITSQAYPKRVFSTREKLVLHLQLKSADYDIMFPSEGRGFKIYIHGPTEFPWSNKQYFRASPGHTVTLTVTPQMIRTENQLKDYSPKRRECFFNAENPLKHFKVYTKENCELECLAEYSSMLCGCIPYWMPRDKGSKVCGLENFECYTLAIYKHLSEALNSGSDDEYLEDIVPAQNASDLSANKNVTATSSNTTRAPYYPRRTSEHRYFAYVFGRQSDEDDDITKKYDNLGVHFKCKCLPACNSINYKADYRTSPLYMEDYTSLPLGYTFLRIEVQFRESQFVPMRRSELFGLYDFVSNFGGLFGLFLGMSLMSLFEILYFATIKLTGAIRRRLRKENEEMSRQREVARDD